MNNKDINNQDHPQKVDKAASVGNSTKKRQPRDASENRGGKKSSNSSMSENNQLEKRKLTGIDLAARDDLFELKYHRAASSVYAPADRLLGELSRESKADKYNFLGFVLPTLLILLLALSFSIVGRGDIEEMFDTKLSVDTVMDGSYTEMLNDIYESTLPFSDEIRTLGAYLGFCDMPQRDEPSDLPPEELPTPDVTEPEVTEPTVTEPEQPEVTTAPTTAEPPATAETQTDIPVEEEDTFIMYASSTVHVRIGPSSEDAVIGYYNSGAAVEVIELRDDGWAEIVFDGIRAYLYSEYLVGDETHDTPDVTAEPIDPDSTETYLMYATASVNVRVAPDSESDRIGGFSAGDEVHVIEILDSGWAAIVYGDVKAYVFAEYIGYGDESSEEVVLPEEETGEVTLPDEPDFSQNGEETSTESINSEDITDSIYDVSEETTQSASDQAEAVVTGTQDEPVIVTTMPEAY